MCLFNTGSEDYMCMCGSQSKKELGKAIAERTAATEAAKVIAVAAALAVLAVARAAAPTKAGKKEDVPSAIIGGGEDQKEKE